MRYDGDDRAEWVLHFDGGCWPNPGGRMAIGWHIDTADGDRVAEHGGPIDPVHNGGLVWASNNVAEFAALRSALLWVSMVKWTAISRLLICGDSQLVVEIASENWKPRKPHLTALGGDCLHMIHRLRDSGVDVVLEWIPREQNAEADDLAEVVA